jgi:uncharacterized protein (DUF305 family)
MPVSSRAETGRRRAAAILAAGVLILVAFVDGRLSAPGSSSPSTADAAAGFARDMQVHHAQAVELSMDVRDLTDDVEIRRLAYDIALTQSQQAGQMYGWLASWGLPQASTAPLMAWMALPALDGSGMQHRAGVAPTTMPGYATRAQIDRLCSLSGRAAECEYLRLMIEHHRGGIEMAQAALERTRQPQVVTLATTIVRAQTAEISAMQTMLDARS